VFLEGTMQSDEQFKEQQDFFEAETREAFKDSQEVSDFINEMIDELKGLRKLVNNKKAKK